MEHFAVDKSILACHQSCMRPRGFIDAMPRNFLRVMGKVLVGGGIFMAAGIALGGTALALESVLGVLGAVGAGVACLIGAAEVHRRSIEACYGELRSPDVQQSATERSLTPEQALDAEDAAVSRFVEQLEAERMCTAGARRLH